MRLIKAFPLIALAFISLPLTVSAILQPQIITVPAGADLQAAINSASTGDTLQLANSTYICNCIDNKGLTIVGPATIQGQSSTEPVVYYPPGTPPAALRNLTVTTAETGQVFSIVRYGSTGPAQDTIEEQPQGLTIESCDITGRPGQEVQRGLEANGRNVRVVGSKIRETHGRGYESQAIGAWNGSGPFTVIDSYLESAGENILIGGALPSIPNLVPVGTELRRNRFYKPPSWRGVWTVKNILEFKTGRNLIIDGNIFDGCWLDAQQGYSILFTVRPNDSGSAAVIEDVQFTNNTIRNVAAGIHLLGQDNLYTAGPKERRLRRVRIANNLFEINGAMWGGDGVFAKIVSGTEDVTIERNTVIQTGNIVKSGGDPHTGFKFTGNIVRHNEYGVHGDGVGYGNPALTTYFPGAVFTGNAIAKEVNAPWNVGLVYPVGNRYPATLNEAVGGDFRPTTAYTGLGVDIDALLAAQGGAQPTPSPTPTPTPTPAPTPSPSPVPFPTPSLPCAMDAPQFITVPANSIGIIAVSLNSMVPQPLPFMVKAVSNSPGQVFVYPSEWQAPMGTGTSAVVTFQVRVKRKGGRVDFSSPCPPKSTTVLIQ